MKTHRPLIVLAGLLGALASSNPAAATPPAPSSPPGAPSACFPGCRAGYVCNEGQCVSLCNPPCGAGEQCLATGECMALSPATTAPVAPSPGTAPASGTRASLSLASPASPWPDTRSPDAPSPTPSPSGPPADGPEVSGASAPRGARVHDGFYFSASLGPGLVASGTVSPPGGPDLSLSGGGVALELALGGTVTRGLALAGSIWGASLPSPSYSTQGIAIDGGGATLSAIGPLADWYFDPTRGLHAQLGLGLAILKASKGSPTTLDGSTVSYPASDQSGNGAALLLGVGYDFWVSDQLSVGFVAHVQYAEGSVKGDSDTSSTSVKVLVPSAEVSVAYN